MTAVHVVMPDGIDDPERPSGGNSYDRHICCGLADAGWSVLEHQLPGSWPTPDAESRASAGAAVATIPDGAVVLFDGLVASAAPEVLVAEARRLRLVVLVHMPLGIGPSGVSASAAVDEKAALSAAVAVVTTSAWTRQLLIDHYGLPLERLHIVEPGAETASLLSGSAAGGELICVAAVTPGKGYDDLIEALATLVDLPWHCVCVGSLHRDPDFVHRIRDLVLETGLEDRLRFTGTRTAEELNGCYVSADLLVLASRAETYGMVVTEALARGLPVVATAVGGVPEALGRGGDGTRPGLLVPAGDPGALAVALRRWLTDVDLRSRLRRAAHERSRSLTTWSTTTSRISQVLTESTA